MCPASDHDKHLQVPTDTLPLPVNRALSRSPHPYHRRSGSIQQHEHVTPDLPPEDVIESESSTERGTEADDERGPILRGLPAPPIKARKGLRGSRTPLDLTPAASPLPTPPVTDNDRSYFLPRKTQRRGRPPFERLQQDADLIKRLTERRRREIGRRCIELLLFLTIGFLAHRDIMVGHQSSISAAHFWVMFGVVLICYALYPARISLRALRRNYKVKAALGIGFHIPSKFDPGSLLYPVFLPLFITLSAAQPDSDIGISNIVLGLASMPTSVIPLGHPSTTTTPHWIITLLPLSVSDLFYSHAGVFKFLSNVIPGAAHESKNIPFALLFPLHENLLITLKYLTSTSLEPSELQLLSAGLINLYLFAGSPQAQILKSVIWVGALCLLVSCRWVLSLEVALARIPSWKFARNRRPKTGLFSQIESVLNVLLPSHKYRPITSIDSDDEDYDHLQSARSRLRPDRRIHAVGVNNAGVSGMDRQEISNASINPETYRRRRALKFPVTTKSSTAVSKQRGKSVGVSRTGLLSLTFNQAQALKWLLACYAYMATIVIVLVAIRFYVQNHALAQHEPFGWALGYLLGNLSFIRVWVVTNNLERWISLPEHKLHAVMPVWVGWVDRLRQVEVGPANTRLLITGYCLLTVVVGIGVVLHLRTVVEVDTRRKVFHGIMVVMLLPTIMLDPCFISLALIVILALFLLLDLFRASQLPPISKPLTTFLAPYVDGRDYRGPVIVSHIFLLIGCAIPLWLSLASMTLTGRDPWHGWEVEGRDLSMISGVVCVGMGDAAASLVGRRFGRTKWFWGGGKSLEGSLAFTAAVTGGLLASYVWIRLGGWATWDHSMFPLTMLKIIAAAAGASLLESVLTAANDNVVVPLGLWLLVRGFKI